MSEYDRLAPLREACKQHPELATILLETLQQIASGPQPRKQLQRPHLAPNTKWEWQ